MNDERFGEQPGIRLRPSGFGRFFAGGFLLFWLCGWAAGEALDLEQLIARVLTPPMRKLGVFEVDRFIEPDEREALALRLNALIASPSASSWTPSRTGRSSPSSWAWR